MAFLRGINVGGKNAISMADLCIELENTRYAAVQTYIQAGNVLFETATLRAELEESVEALLAERLGSHLMIGLSIPIKIEDELQYSLWCG